MDTESFPQQYQPHLSPSVLSVLLDPETNAAQAIEHSWDASKYCLWLLEEEKSHQIPKLPLFGFWSGLGKKPSSLKGYSSERARGGGKAVTSGKHSKEETQDVKALSQTDHNPLQMTSTHRQDPLNTTSTQKNEARSWIWGLETVSVPCSQLHHTQEINLPSKSRPFFCSPPTRSVSLSQLAEVPRQWAVRDSWHQNDFSIWSCTFPRVSQELGVWSWAATSPGDQQPSVHQVDTFTVHDIMLYLKKDSSSEWSVGFSTVLRKKWSHQLHSCTSIPKCWTPVNTTGCCQGSTHIWNCCRGLQPQIFTETCVQFA